MHDDQSPQPATSVPGWYSAAVPALIAALAAIVVLAGQ
jgi:hypothetical protein